MSTRTRRDGKGRTRQAGSLSGAGRPMIRSRVTGAREQTCRFAEYGRYDALGARRTGAQGAGEPGRAARRGAGAHGGGQPEGQCRDPPDGRRVPATAIAAGLPDGPFSGVPFLIKDLMTAYAGEPMRCGSRLFKDFVPAEDEELTRRYGAAGLVIFGKTNTPELGVTNVTEPELFGPTRNPWNLERTLERLERRLGRRGRGAHRAGGQRQRRRRLDPHAGLELRARRPEAEPRPQSHGAAGARRLVGVHRRARRHAHGARQRRAARCDGGRLSAAADEAAAHPSGRTSRRPAASPAGCGSRSRSTRASARPCTPRTARRSRPRPRCSTGSGTRSSRCNCRCRPSRSSTSYAALISADVAATLRTASQLVGREATSDDVELATWMLAKMGEAQSAADVAAALWTMQTFSRQWLAWAARLRRAADAHGRRAATADRRLQAVDAAAPGTQAARVAAGRRC